MINPEEILKKHCLLAGLTEAEMKENLKDSNAKHIIDAMIEYAEIVKNTKGKGHEICKYCVAMVKNYDCDTCEWNKEIIKAKK